MSLVRNIRPIKPYTNKVHFNYYEVSKRYCLLACQKASKTRSLQIFSKSEWRKKGNLKIWKHFTRNRGIRELAIKMGSDSQGNKWKDAGRLILLYQNLMSLYFDCPDLTFPTLRLARPWFKSRMLKELHYNNHADELTNSDLVYLFRRISHMPKLSDLSLYCTMTTSQLEERPEMLPVLPSRLTSIGIHIDGLSVFWKNYINAWLLKNPNLKTANLTLVHTNQEEEIDPSLDNALKSVSQCDSISLYVIDFISRNGLNSLLQDVPGVFERIDTLKLINLENLDTLTFSLAVPYLQSLVHIEAGWEYCQSQEAIESIIVALSCAPPKSLKTLIILMDHVLLTQSIVTGLQKILRETNLEEFRFYDFLNKEFPLLQIVVDSCLDRPARLRKLSLGYITLLTDRIKEINTQNLYLDSVKELDLYFGKENQDNVNMANQVLKNWVNLFSCFKNLDHLSCIFSYPISNSFLFDLTPLFSICPLRKFEVNFNNGILNFNEFALERIIFHYIRTKTFEDLTIHIDLQKEQLNGLVPINIGHFKRFDSLLKRHQKLSISVKDGRKRYSYEFGKNHFADLTKRYQF